MEGNYEEILSGVLEAIEQTGCKMSLPLETLKEKILNRLKEEKKESEKLEALTDRIITLFNETNPSEKREEVCSSFLTFLLEKLPHEAPCKSFLDSFASGLLNEPEDLQREIKKVEEFLSALDVLLTLSQKKKLTHLVNQVDMEAIQKAIPSMNKKSSFMISSFLLKEYFQHRGALENIFRELSFLALKTRICTSQRGIVPAGNDTGEFMCMDNEGNYVLFDSESRKIAGGKFDIKSPYSTSSIAFNCSGKFLCVSCTSGKKIFLYKVEREAKTASKRSKPEFKLAWEAVLPNSASVILWVDEDEFLVGTEEATITRFSASFGHKVKEYRTGLNSMIRAMDIGKKDKTKVLIGGNMSPNLVMYSLAEEKIIWSQVISDYIMTVSLDPSENIAVCGGYQEILMCLSAKTGETVSAFEGAQKSDYIVYRMMWAPNEEVCFVVNGREIKTFRKNEKTLEIVSKLDAPPDTYISGMGIDWERNYMLFGTDNGKIYRLDFE